jgi:3'-5' exoribonuclease
MFVREFTDGCEVEQALLVREVERRARRDGGEYLRLLLGDRTGAVPAMVWDDLAAALRCAQAGEVVWVSARFGLHARYGPQLTLRGPLRAAAAHEYRPEDLHDGPPLSPERMEQDLAELVGTVQSPHLRRLLERLLGARTPTGRRYREAPAAKRYHQAYRHGLLEHSLSVAKAVSAISAMFPGIDRDVAVTGALLHDLGKLEAYTAGPQAIDLTDAGRLQGEIALGYYRVRQAMEELEGFPPDLAQAVGHIILSHHGSLEHGSPVVPCTREATLVHMIDNLGGRLGSFDRLEKELPDGERWSAYDRALSAPAYFAGRAAA